MSKNAEFCNGEENEIVVQNADADPDHHLNIITSRGSPLAHVGHGSPLAHVGRGSPLAHVGRGSPLAHVGRAKFDQHAFPVRQLSCLQNDRQNDHITSALLAQVITVQHIYLHIHKFLRIIRHFITSAAFKTVCMFLKF